MDMKSNGDVNTSAENGLEFDKPDITGWLFRFSPDGWFRKRWRKKWCILRDEAIFIHDSEATSNNNKNCVMLDLKLYLKCVEASKKECKKSPHTIALELPQFEKKPPNNKVTAQKLNRELFYTATEEEKCSWLEKINQAINAAKTGKGKGSNLSHVTKSRAKPSAVQRRPPTRKHLRDRAAQSQLLPGIDFETETEEEEEKETATEKRGKIPSTALMPLPGIKIAILNKKISASTGALNEITEEEENENKIEKRNEEPPIPTAAVGLDKDTLVQPFKLPTPVPSPRRKILKKDVPAADEVTTAPPVPNKDLEPKLVATAEEEQQENNEIFENEKGLTAEAENADIIDTKIDKRPSSSLSGSEVDSQRSSSPQPNARAETDIKNSNRFLNLPEIKVKTRSLDRQDFPDHTKSRSAPSSFNMKPANSENVQTVLQKAQALQTQLKFPNFGDGRPIGGIRMSKSLDILDKVDDDLPPPPEPPPAESVSDLDVRSDDSRPKKKKDKMRNRTSSNPALSDEADQ